MNTHDARFILQSYRSEGRHASDDPIFAEALTVARQDLELSAWLEHELEMDGAVCRKLDQLSPPVGLRDAIIDFAPAGPTERPPWWRRMTNLAAAAAVLAFAGLMASRTSAEDPTILPTAFAQIGVEDFLQSRHVHRDGGQIDALAAKLGAHQGSFRIGLDVDCETMRNHGCRCFSIADREVFEVCFKSESGWYHLYVTRCTGNSGLDGADPVIQEQSGVAAAAWVRGGYLFALATRSGVESLRHML